MKARRAAVLLGALPPRMARVSPTFLHSAALRSVQAGRSPSLAICYPVLAEGQVFTRAPHVRGANEKTNPTKRSSSHE